MNDRFFINMPIPADKFETVCAVLAGVSTAINPGKSTQRAIQPDDNQQPPLDSTVAGQTGAAGQPEQSAGAGASPPVVDDSDGIDAHGHPWSADLHASTKGKTKDGLWRMKVGVTRPDPLPGFPVDNSAGTGTSSATPAPSATSQTATDQGNGQPATEEDDEFAAFRTAAAASDATDKTAAESIPARQYSDADLGALCNQAAVKLGDPGPVKAIIAKYTPEGSVAHSRNIPAEQRAAFVGEVETAAGITFAG